MHQCAVGFHPSLKIMVPKIPRSWSSGIMNHLNTDFKLTAVTVHVTVPSNNCTSKKNNSVVKLVIIQYQRWFRKMKWNWADYIRYLYCLNSAVVPTSPFRQKWASSVHNMFHILCLFTFVCARNFKTKAFLQQGISKIFRSLIFAFNF